MHYTRRALLGLTATTVVLAGCIGDDEGGEPSPTPTSTPTPEETPTPTPTPGSEVTVMVADHPELGEILVDADGMTLYQFDADTQGANESTCYDDCAQNWPPLIVDDPEPTAGDGVTAPLTTFERNDGSLQVAADGWPLYYWVGDEDPGDTNGQGVQEVWWVLRPDGTVVREDDDEDEDDDDDDDGNGDPSPGY